MLTYFSYGDRNKNKLALTFDDGPARYTETILKILAKHNIRATFFVLGKKSKENPELLRKIVKAGHLVGNHGYSHSRFFERFNLSETLIKEIIGTKLKFIRILICQKLFLL